MKKLKSKGAASLMALLIPMVIAAILTVIIIITLTGGKKEGAGDLHTSLDRGKSIQCLARIKKLDTATKFYYMQKSDYPESLKLLYELEEYRDLCDLSEKDFQCPTTGDSYNYDPKTGKITCPVHQEEPEHQEQPDFQEQ